MDFHGIECPKEKDMAELMENASNSERIEEGKAKDHAAETNYNNKITSINHNAIKINMNKGSLSSGALGLLSNCSCEKGSFSTELRLGMAFEELCDQEIGLPSSIRTVNGGVKRAVGEPIPRLDLSSVGSCSNSINLFPSQSGFGSPIEVMEGFQHRTSSDDNQDGCSGFVTSFRPSQPMIPQKQSGPQLTIFYGGTVNVYDDISADKAQAIMLVASSGNYSSYRHTEVQNGCESRTEQKISAPVMNLLERSAIHPQPAIRKVNTGSDLPIARKHSLQRFLEKRKDRMNTNAKSTYMTAKAESIKLQQHPSSSPIWLQHPSSSPIWLHSNSPS